MTDLEPARNQAVALQQAIDGRYAFYRRLRELAPQFRDTPVVHVVIFPNAEFEISPNLSVQPGS